MRYIRQAAILNPQDAANTKITVAGCGTVGSNAAVQLAKAGFGTFTLIDDDTVEEHNLPSQAFGVGDVGRPKAEALAKQLTDMHGAQRTSAQARRLSGRERLSADVLVLAVDSNDMRRKLAASCSGHAGAPGLIVDLRMGGWVLQAWAFDPLDHDQAERYLATVPEGGQIDEMPCGTRTFAPVGALAGALATMLVTKHLSKDLEPEFYTYFDAETMTTIHSNQEVHA